MNITNLNHTFKNNYFYGEEDLNTPLNVDGKPLRGVEFINCQPITMYIAEFYNFQNPSENTFPVFLDRTTYTVSNIVCDGYTNSGIFATTSVARYTLTVLAGKILNFIGPYSSVLGNGNGIQTKGYNLTTNAVEIYDFKDMVGTRNVVGINCLPITNNKFNINGGEIAASGSGIQINAVTDPITKKYKLLDYTGSIKNVLIYDGYFGISLNGRTGQAITSPFSPKFTIENNYLVVWRTMAIRNYECHLINTIHNTLIQGGHGIFNAYSGDLFTGYNGTVEELPISSFFVAGIAHNQVTNSIYRCNFMKDNGKNGGNNGFGMIISADARGVSIEQNTWESNKIAFKNQTAGTLKLPLQVCTKNKWIVGTNDINIDCGSNLDFQIADSDFQTDFDPVDCHATGGPSKDYDCNDDVDVDIAIFKTQLLDDIVTGNISYPSGYQGEAYDNRWYAYGLLHEYPDLLNDYAAAETFYDAIDTSTLADLYFVYYGLYNLYSDLETECDTLNARLNRIDEIQMIVMEAYDSLNIEEECSKNDSLVAVIDSLNGYIITLVAPVDSLRDTIESSVQDKISALSGFLSSISSSDSIQNKLKQVLGIWVDRATNDTLTSEQLATLQYIAYQCYYTFGPAVQLARIFYNVSDGYDDENCPSSLILSNNNKQYESKALAYPNPSNNKLVIKLPELLNSPVKITDLEGKSYFNTKVNSKDKELVIDVSDWPNGNYFITYFLERVRSFKILILK